MEDGRKGDVRIYIIACLFFICIVGGGIFLCLYIFLPDNPWNSWYPVAGMVLVAMPWVFWLITYIYHLLKPCCIGHGSIEQEEQRHFTKGGGSWVASKRATSSSLVESPKVNSPNGGGRHVHFAEVVVMGIDDDDDGNGGGGKEKARGGVQSHSTTASSISNEGGGDHSIASSESEMPLKFSVSS